MKRRSRRGQKKKSEGNALSSVSTSESSLRKMAQNALAGASAAPRANDPRAGGGFL